MKNGFLLGRILLGIAFAVYGFMHFANAEGDASIVPAFVGMPYFWTYFVGLCWMAAALSFFSGILIRISGWLSALMLLLILIFVHLPGFHGLTSLLGIASILGLMGGCVMVSEGSRDK